MIKKEKTELIDISLIPDAWPFIEAKEILKRLQKNTYHNNKGFILFETGYGPSGLPHVGTFGEVARTSMVMHAFKTIYSGKVKLLCVSDDMDAMRKIPDTIPNPEEFKRYLNFPLSSIPDPFATHKSFADNMNAKMRAFLDEFNIDYEFCSSSEYYKQGKFNDGLIAVLKNYDKIMDVMLPTLREERRKTYSPFLPICKRTGKVLQVPIIDINVQESSISYRDPENDEIIWTKITNGNCKLQWKVDFGMRWALFDVDFEMYGKDHLVNGKIYSQICEIVGGKAPHQMFFELFTDENGCKISKSQGNGLTIEEWLKYAPKESLALLMYLSPRKSKKMYIGVIPKYTDDYIAYLNQYASETDITKKLNNPVYHIHQGNPPLLNSNINYSLILNLLSALHTKDKEIIYGYLAKSQNNNKHDERKMNFSCPFLEQIIQGAINYYCDHIEPYKEYRQPTYEEKQLFEDLKTKLSLKLKEIEKEKIFTPEELQNVVYSVASDNSYDVKNWFSAIYEVLLGSKTGPRFGAFIYLFGISKTIALIEEKINNAINKE